MFSHNVRFTTFIFDGGGYITSDDNFISGSSVKKAAKKIHEAGGCDATDEYGRGYDDAVLIVKLSAPAFDRLF